MDNAPPAGSALGQLELPMDPAELPVEIRARLEARVRAHPGKRIAIGRYIILGELGRGGMGVVYDAWDPRIERQVAVKTIEPDLVPDEQEREEVIERFLREIKVVGRLSHPGIVTIFDYGEEPELRRGDDPYAHGRTYYYVMEYLEGRPLAKVLKTQPIIPDVEAVQIAIDIADALAMAHAQKIIHRDIKPSNIFIRQDGGAVLLDFGIAKTSSPGLTRQGQILGTPTYLAPERLREKEIPLDGRADLFSLGVLLYTMLAGRAPFEGSDVYDLIDNIATQAHPKLARNTEGGRRLSEVLDRLLAKNPDGRYASAAEAVSALRGVKRKLDDASGPWTPVSIPDGKTELQTARAPVSVNAANQQLPSAGTLPEQSLQRETRQIPFRDNTWDPDEPPELSGSELQLLADPRRTDPDRHLPTEPAPARGLAPEPGTVPPPPQMDIPAARRIVDARTAAAPPPAALTEPAPRKRLSELLEEDETVADPDRALAQTLPRSRLSAARSEATTDSGAQLGATPASQDAATELVSARAPELVPAAATEVSPSAPQRIQASLVDEDDVVVKPAPLDGEQDELPTQTAFEQSEGALQTEIVRARRPAADPAEEGEISARARAVRRAQSGAGRSAGAVEVFVRSSSGVRQEGGASSAAVARKTIGVGRADGAASPSEGRRKQVGDIKVTAMNLDIGRGPSWQRAMKKRAAVFLGAALMAVAAGILLGRGGGRPSQAPIPPMGDESTPAPRAVAGTSAQVEIDLVRPRSAREVLEEGEAALGAGHHQDALELFKRVLDTTSSAMLQARAHLGRGHAYRALGASKNALASYRDASRLGGNGAAGEEARRVLESMNRASSLAGPPITTPTPKPKKESRPEPPAPSLRTTAPTGDPQERCRQAARRYFTEPDQAVAELEAMKSTLGHWCVHYHLGGFYNKRGDRRRAIQAFQEYLRLRPDAEDRDRINKEIQKLSSG